MPINQLLPIINGQLISDEIYSSTLHAHKLLTLIYIRINLYTLDLQAITQL